MNSLKTYQYWNPVKITFGPNALSELTKEVIAKEVPLIVTDKGIVNSAILKKLTGPLKTQGIRYHVFDSVEPDPAIEVVQKGAAEYRDHKCSLLIGLGGGSSIDTAKAIGISATQKKDLKEYSRGNLLERPIPPIIAIPTTAGTGAEVSPIAVISDHENKIKMLIRDIQLFPKVAVLDPVLLASIPPRIAAETGADALCHAIESYISPNSNSVTEALAISAIQLISQNLGKTVANPKNIESSGQMLTASCLAGLSFSNTGLGIAHSMAHPLGVHCHLSHGLSCALTLPIAMEFNSVSCSEKFALIAEAMGVGIRTLAPDHAANRAIIAVKELLVKIGLPGSLPDLGIDFQLDPKMVEEVLASPATVFNPRKADSNQIEELFARLMKQR